VHNANDNCDCRCGFVPATFLLLAPTGPAPQVTALPAALTLTGNNRENEIEYVLVEIKDREGIDIDGLAYEVLVGLPGGKVRGEVFSIASDSSKLS
jgi:hypothetical protein